MLVVVNGVPRAGRPDLMGDLALSGEQVDVAGGPRVLNLTQPAADPAVAAVSVKEAVHRLDQALADLPNSSGTVAAVQARPESGHALLAVEGVIDNHMSPRPHLPYRGRLTGPNLRRHREQALTGATPRLPALTLDPLTAIDNPDYYKLLADEANLPVEIRDGLAALAP